MEYFVECNCGAKLRFQQKDIGRRGVCPYCSESVALGKAKDEEEIITAELVTAEERYSQPVHEYLDPPKPPLVEQGSPFASEPPTKTATKSPPESVASQPSAPTTPAEEQPPWLERALNNLLSPRSIQWMFVIGGGAMVLGLIVWLVSLGVFDDPRLVAGALTLGSFAVYAVGVVVSMRTKGSMVGQAITFLGCVLLPLNLWYYHAQGLLTLDGPLWVAALACCLVYVATVVLLRDPVFIYAVQAGITLTALLLLGNLGWIADAPTLCLLFLSLAVISIHAERLFTLGGEKTKPFGLPAFFSGHIYLLVSLAILAIVQPLGWLGDIDSQIGRWSWANNLLTNSALLTAAVWLVGAWLYCYSDIVVRKIGVYVFAGAACLLMTEITLAAAADILLEWRLALLSTSALVLAIVFHFVGKQNQTAQRFFPPAVLFLSVPSLLLGLLLHARATIAGWELAEQLHYETRWPFLVAMLWSAVCARVCAYLFSEKNHHVSAVFLFLSAGGLAAAFAGLLRVVGITDWVYQAPLLMLVPIGYIIAAKFERGRWNEQPLGWVAHVLAGMILVSTLLSSWVDLGERLGDLQLQLFQGGISNLLLAATFALGAAFYQAAAYVRKKGVNHAFSAIAGGAAIWQLLVFMNVPLEWVGPVLAIGGLAATFAARYQGLSPARRFTAGGDWYTVYEGPGRLLHNIGHGLLSISWLVSWVAAIAVYNHAIEPKIWSPIISLFLSAGLAVLAAFMTSGGTWRHVHAFAAAVLGLTGAFLIYLQLDLDPWQVLEYTTVAVGVVLLIASFIGSLFEEDDQPSDLVTVGLAVGAFCAAIPLFISVLVHRYFEGVIFLPDELGFITVGIAMLVLGIMLQTRAPVVVGACSTLAYAIVLIISIFYIPQLTIGVYLAIGGGSIFAVAVLLSVFRERLIAMPGKFARREGAFAWLTWR